MKKTDWYMAITVLLIPLIVVVSVVFFCRADIYSEKQASLLGGIISAFAAMALGILAFLQNKRYKELADEKAKQAEELMFTPECIPIGIGYSALRYDSYLDVYPVKGNYQGMSVYLQFETLNYPMIDISVNAIDCKGTKSADRMSRTRNQITVQPSSTTVLKSYERFTIEVVLPYEFANMDVVCSIVLVYKNMYGSSIEKKVTFERKHESGKLSIANNERARISEN